MMHSSLVFAPLPAQHIRFDVHDQGAFREATDRSYSDAVYRSPITLLQGVVDLPGASVGPCGWEPQTRALSGVVLCALEAVMPPHEKGEDVGTSEGERLVALVMRAVDAWGPVPYSGDQRRTFVRLAAHLGFGVGVPEEALVPALAYHAGSDIVPGEVHDVYSTGSPFFAWGQTRLEREPEPEEPSRQRAAVVPDPKVLASVQDAMSRRRARSAS